jgi:group I intron endonuclease
MAIVYKITNTVNGKCYIGATEKTLEERWNGHVKSSRLNKRNRLISHAIRKYGTDAFIIEILEEHPDRKHVFDVLEPKYILEHNTFGDNGYNMTFGGEGFGVRHTHSDETKEKLRLSGLKRTHTPETREKLRNAALNRTPEHKEKIRQSLIGKECTPETREKIRRSKIGIPHSTEHKEKLRQSALNKKHKHTTETKEKIRIAHTGKKLSSEHKEKIRQSIIRSKHYTTGKLE